MTFFNSLRSVDTYFLLFHFSDLSILSFFWSVQINRGMGGMNWEPETDIYTLLYIKSITNENVLYSTGDSPWCSVETSKEGYPKKEEIYVYIG